MSEENVEIVRRSFEAYLRGDYPEAVSYLAPDVVYEVGQELPARGPDEVREKWQRWDDVWDQQETVAEEYIDAGDHVVVAVRYSARGRGSGIEVGTRSFEVHTFRDGKCVHKRDFNERSKALEAAGLSE